MEISEDIAKKIQLLQEKFAVMGQDLASYLDGLLYSEYLTYWDYVHLDTLLSLQTPRTPFADEPIFIMYHQITELYFKLCLHELKQIGHSKDLNLETFKLKVGRVVRYFEHLRHSFDVMTDGMDKEQFLKFRMALLPASGFQSAQYRMIEICCTDFFQLTAPAYRASKEEGHAVVFDEYFENLYWKSGATELASNQKTLTLKQFEGKYSSELKQLIQDFGDKNLRKRLHEFEAKGEADEELKSLLRELDLLVNVYWPLSHYRSAVRYLNREPKEIAATGGTNWQKYLPPMFQRVIFFPELWEKEQLENWGKTSN